MNRSRSIPAAIVLLLALLACLPGPTPVNTAPPPVDTAAPAATAEPTKPAAQQYFTEGFDEDTGNWSHFVVDASKQLTSPGAPPSLASGDVEKMNVGISDGRLVFDLTGKGLWVYSTYDGYEYEDVRLDVVAENRGVNDNNVSLICRYNKDEGWYEFNIANNGLYDIYYARFSADKIAIYGKLADGGSNKIHQGKETNTYSISCKGRTLTLFINGIETRRLDDNQYVLRKGKIGVSVSSFNALPVKVEFDSVKISEP